MKSVKVASLNVAKVGDVVELSFDDLYECDSMVRIFLYSSKEKLLGFVYSIKKTSLHGHPYFAIITKHGWATVKKGNW